MLYITCSHSPFSDFPHIFEASLHRHKFKLALSPLRTVALSPPLPAFTFNSSPNGRVHHPQHTRFSLARSLALVAKKKPTLVLTSDVVHSDVHTPSVAKRTTTIISLRYFWGARKKERDDDDDDSCENKIYVDDDFRRAEKKHTRLIEEKLS